jgi:hypothetical protein
MRERAALIRGMRERAALIRARLALERNGDGGCGGSLAALVKLWARRRERQRAPSRREGYDAAGATVTFDLDFKVLWRRERSPPGHRS